MLRAYTYVLLLYRSLDAVTDGMKVVLVPREEGKHFIWPGYDIGHKFEVPDVQHPVPERPIQLEMMVRDCHTGDIPGCVRTHHKMRVLTLA